jgi:hypothetical protein
MRKLIVSLLTATSQLLAFGSANANANRITLNEQPSAGILTDRVCLTIWG